MQYWSFQLSFKSLAEEFRLDKLEEFQRVIEKLNFNGIEKS